MERTKKVRVIQIGILVRDIEKSAKAWEKYLGIEPIFAETAEYKVTGATYKGKPCYGLLKQALFNLDNIQIELVSPLNEETSVWLDCLEKEGEGLHHIAFQTDDMDTSVKEMTDAGYKVMQYGSWPAEPKVGKYSYMDSREDMKTIIELLEC